MARKPVTDGGKREKIVVAAMKCFLEKGYDGTSIRAIMKKAGGEVGLFYKNAVFDTNRKSLLRHISAEKGLKQRAFEVPLCFTAEFRKPFFCLFDCCWPVLWPLELTPQNRQSKE